MPDLAHVRVHTIDLLYVGMPHLIAAYLLESDGELALIETGPGASLNLLLKSIRELGFDPTAIKKVFVTHIHLDHSGAAGWWAQQGATVYVHPKGAPHLIDPEKLISSAQRIYGDRMDYLWGEILPAPADRVVVLQDGDEVSLGAVQIKALDTPGHARHHHAYACGKVCFTGDVAGMRLPGCNYISVTAAPPQFDPVAYDVSLARLETLGFERLYLTHFGLVEDVATHLATYRRRVQAVHQLVQGFLDQGLRGDELHRAYAEAERQVAKEAGATDVDWAASEAGNPTGMGADGIALYCEKAGQSGAS